MLMIQGFTDVIRRSRWPVV